VSAGIITTVTNGIVQDNLAMREIRSRRRNRNSDVWIIKEARVRVDTCKEDRGKPPKERVRRTRKKG
jgi:hypothetical protein